MNNDETFNEQIDELIARVIKIEHNIKVINMWFIFLGILTILDFLFLVKTFGPGVV
ncbi:MAG: hypothetical protein H0S79_18390 [Anaerolineaceae bacterium]|nr:hypothetical protein [Anaerolineaceae bacterium]